MMFYFNKLEAAKKRVAGFFKKTRKSIWAKRTEMRFGTKGLNALPTIFEKCSACHQTKTYSMESMSNLVTNP